MAARPDLSALQLHEVPTEGQTKARSCLGIARTRRKLNEPIEDPRQILRRDADTGVFDGTLEVSPHFVRLPCNGIR